MSYFVSIYLLIFSIFILIFFMLVNCFLSMLVFYESLALWSSLSCLWLSVSMMRLLLGLMSSCGRFWILIGFWLNLRLISWRVHSFILAYNLANVSMMISHRWMPLHHLYLSSYLITPFPSWPEPSDNIFWKTDYTLTFHAKNA